MSGPSSARRTVFPASVTTRRRSLTAVSSSVGTSARSSLTSPAMSAIDINCTAIIKFEMAKKDRVSAQST